MNDRYHAKTPLPSRSEIVSLPEQESDSASAVSRRNRGSWRKVVWCGLGILVLLIVTAFTVQSIITPPVDPDLKVPVAVQPTTSADGALDVLPLHAITHSITQEVIDQAEHPLIPLLEVARKGVDYMDENVQDYESTVISQVRVNDVLGEERYIRCKVRHRGKVDGKIVPFSIYTCFLKPQSVAGQEAIWVKGRNRGKIIAHGAGLLNIKRFYLNPQGAIAMKGNRYSIENLGMKNLIQKMIDKADNDLVRGECSASITRGVELDGHICTMLQIIHPEPRDYFEFHIARIYIDDNRNLPIAYEGFLWPEKQGDPPPLLEKYYYTDIKLNNGFTKLDFSPRNSEYNYPGW